MATIGIWCDLEEGHLFPSFGLAQKLREAGHSITYLVIKDLEEHVKRAGFDCRVILEAIYPVGTTRQHHRISLANDDREPRPHISPLINGALDPVLESLNADLILTSYFLSLEALILYHRYRVPQVLFCTYLRQAAETPRAECVEAFMHLEGATAGEVVDYLIQSHRPGYASLDDIANPLDTLPELILCPKEFDLPANDIANRNVVYGGPCLRRSDDGSIALPEGKRMLFTSFGSQSSLYRNVYLTLVTHVIAAMQRPGLRDFHMVISLGEGLKNEPFGPVPDNVTLATWVPQLEVIKRSELVITHGGLGTVKECVYHGVPMLVMPMARDQPDNAQRVEAHFVGKRISPDALSAGSLTAIIENVLGDERIKQSVLAMKSIFRQREQQTTEVDFINEVLTKASLV